MIQLEIFSSTTLFNLTLLFFCILVGVVVILKAFTMNFFVRLETSSSCRNEKLLCSTFKYQT